MTKTKRTQIGKIPEDWEVVNLGAIIEYVKGKKPEEMIDELKEGYLPYLSTEYLRNNRKPKFAKTSENIVLTNEGDLILLWDGSNAGEFFIGKEGVLSSTMVKIQFRKGDVNQMFLFYLLKTRENYLSGQTRGTGIPHVDKNVLENLTILLPPLLEQKAIAQILSTADKAIKKSDGIIAKTEKLKKGLMQELLTNGVINGFMFDTTVFGNILDKKIDINKFPKKFDYYITHIQPDELNKTKDKERKKKLLRFFKEIRKEELSTESFVLNYSRLAKAKLGNGKILEELRKGNLKHTEDALIGEVAIKKDLILVTNDKILLNGVKALNGQAVTLEQFLSGEYKEFKDTEIGKIPNDWKVKKIKEISKTYAGGTPSRSIIHYYEGNILWVKSGEINKGIIFDTEEKITELGLKNSNAKIVPKNTVLVAMYGATAGKVGILKVEGTTNQAVLAIPNDKNAFDYNFMYYLLSSKTQKFTNRTQGTGQPNLSKILIDNLIVQLPSLLEQQKIALILSTIDKKLEHEKSRKQKFKRIKKGLMNDLLTGNKRIKFRG